MPLNKLENFIKNTEGRILYVNPNDLDSTDGIENQGNSLTKPFKTIQRALIEAARFSYLRGDDNDLVERTTILLFPGEHIVDNRPGFAIRNDSGVAKAISPAGTATGASNTFELTLDSNFDLTNEDNILYKFNSVNGGVVVPRGTSIVGLDLRKTKVRPKYVPNPTDSNVANSAIFRITGACYFWQFTIFDGDESGTVFTDSVDFSDTNRSKPTFSHHKLTVFEYADGVNRFEQFSDLSDLDIFYSKLPNAFNRASGREIDQKYPAAPKAFAPQRPEFEIVGAFATDPVNITNIESGDGATPGQQVTVTTSGPHNLSGGTPIKIRGVNVPDYNISTKVGSVLSTTQFTYLLPFVRPNLPAGSAGGLSAANAQVLVETDTVSGASPYIFNISLRSVYGMQGMHADGAKATGFRSMVVAQFTAVSLQKDDRAFVKYDPTNRTYSGIQFSKQTGELLSSESSSTNPNTVYHLDQEANYRKGFRTTHIKVSNDAVVQIVSVFAIGFHSHFNMINGADASITNSNSNFGTFALAAEGFKKEAFAKDDKGFVTSIITPRSIVTTEQKIEYLQVDATNTNSDTRLYLFGQESETIPPSHIVQGYRVGAKVGEKIYVDNENGTFQATVVMSNGTTTGTTNTSEKSFEVTHSAATASNKSVFTLSSGSHNLQNGESIRIFADDGDLPENIDPHTVYFAITGTGNGNGNDTTLGNNQIRIASSKTNADLDSPVFINTVASTNAKFTIVSRVSDKKPGEAGHPAQFDGTRWFLHTLGGSSNTIYSGGLYAGATTDDITYVLRKEDDRGIDEKIYKVRYVVPKELVNGRDPTEGFVLQDSSSTNVLSDSDFNRSTITSADYEFNRNLRFISQVSFDSGNNKVTLRSDKPHNMKVGNQIIVKNVQSSTNTNGVDDKGYNGTFIVTDVDNSKEFKYSNTDVLGAVHTVGIFVNNTHTRSTLLPRFERNDVQSNLFVYRSEIITPYIQGVQDGIYHLYVLNAENTLSDPSNQFDNDKFNQNIVNLYPQHDRDNFDDNPPEAVSYAKRFPIGDVVTNDLKKSITRETANKFLSTFDATDTISTVTGITTNTADLTFTAQHEYQSLNRHNNLTGGSGHTNGTYYNIKLFNTNASPGSAVWDGATAQVTVSGNSVTSVNITEGGSGYTNGETLFFDSSSVATGGIGGAPSASISIATAGISTALGNYVQVTGITTGTDGYYRIHSVSNTNGISVKKSSTDVILEGQQVIDLGPWTLIGGVTTPYTFDSVTGISTFHSTASHGLVVGNSFRVLNADDTNLGDFVVQSVVDFNTFTAVTTSSLSSPKYILKHGLSANEALSSSAGENVGVRGLSIYDHDTLRANEGINGSESGIRVRLLNGSTSTSLSAADADQIRQRFPIGTYVQIEGEILRVSSNTIGGGNNDNLTFIRGALGTISASHPNNVLIKKIKPLPIEFRRPSILRASGHTFEYVGYGPGNYSTALPQLQNRSLTEREEFLSQSQETSCGNVVYTGMNDKGDFYIGNTKISSSSGQQSTFDIPIPTITGEDPNRLSLVADEVIVKERILVEGGTSKQILSQFDGPVTFNENVRLANPNSRLTVEGDIRAQSAKFRDTTQSTSINSGAVEIDGGLGVAKNIYINGNFRAQNDNNSDIGHPSFRFQDVYAVNFHGDGANLTNTGAQMSTPATGQHPIVLTNVTSGTMVTGFTDSTFEFNLGTNSLIVPNIRVLNDLVGTATTATAAETVDVAQVGGGTFNVVLTSAGTASGKPLYLDTGITYNNTGSSDSLTVAGSIRCDDIKIAVNGATEINTVQGNLVLDSDSGTVEVTDNLSCFDLTTTGNNLLGNGTGDDTTVSGKLFVSHGDNATAENDGALQVTGGISCTKDLYVKEKIRAGDDIIAFESSDINLKENITPIPNAIDKINAISGNTFSWKSDSDCLNGYGGKDDVGVIAQEVEALGLVGLTTTRDNGVKAVRYEKLIPVLIQAVKELSAKVTALEGS